MLRVIAGLYKSRKINDVKSKNTRPTTDKNKESMFNSIGQFFDGGRCLDLYAGSGALGIEALSRGLDFCDFVDHQYKAIQTILSNIQLLKLQKQSKIIKKDGLLFLQSTKERYDLILMDPPYALKPYQECLELIYSRQLLNNHGIIVMESDHQTLINGFQNIHKIKEKVMGQTKITIFRKENNYESRILSR